MLFYGEGGFDQQPKLIDGDGDGTVILRNLCAIISYWYATEGLPDDILSDSKQRLIYPQVLGIF